jgi:hypothetical protein
MGRTRRSRRRIARQRASRPVHAHRLGAGVRLGLVAAGGCLILAGALLLVAGGTQTAERLGRIAGILIVLGLVALGAAAIGHV